MMRTLNLILLVIALGILTGCKKETTVKIPKSMSIVDIKVTRFPEFNNGANWDSSDAPDLTIDLKQENNLVWTSPSIINNLDSLNYKSFLTAPLTIDSLTRQYIFTMYDVDGLASKELMGEVLFTPWDGTYNKPTNITLDDGGPVALRLAVRYNY